MSWDISDIAIIMTSSGVILSAFVPIWRDSREKRKSQDYESFSRVEEGVRYCISNFPEVLDLIDRRAVSSRYYDSLRDGEYNEIRLTEEESDKVREFKNKIAEANLLIKSLGLETFDLKNCIQEAIDNPEINLGGKAQHLAMAHRQSVKEKRSEQIAKVTDIGASIISDARKNLL